MREARIMLHPPPRRRHDLLRDRTSRSAAVAEVGTSLVIENVCGPRGWARWDHKTRIVRLIRVDEPWPIERSPTSSGQRLSGEGSAGANGLTFASAFGAMTAVAIVFMLIVTLLVTAVLCSVKTPSAAQAAQR